MDYDFYKSAVVDDESKSAMIEMLADNIVLQKIVDFYELEIKKYRNNLKEKELANKRKLEFICHLSHDFKTPLNAIKGFIYLIIESCNSEKKILSYCENILKASDHLYELLESSLKMASVETDNIELEYSCFSANKIIAEILCVLDSKIKEKKLVVKNDLMEISICADKRRFRQILYNMIGNSIKFNKHGGSISIYTCLKNNMFYFEIKDTGCGIKNKDKSKIFEFFSCSPCVRLDVVESTGIGLSLCKKIITLHGGQIDFVSEPNIGSTFWFYLPITPIESQIFKQ